MNERRGKERYRKIEGGKERGAKRDWGGNGEFNFRTTRNSPSFATASKNKLCSLLTPPPPTRSLLDGSKRNGGRDEGREDVA